MYNEKTTIENTSCMLIFIMDCSLLYRFSVGKANRWSSNLVFIGFRSLGMDSVTKSFSEE